MKGKFDAYVLWPLRYAKCSHQYQYKMNAANLQDGKICLFVCNRGDTIQYHSGVPSRELGQSPMPHVFLTPRQALSPHPRQQMV